MRRGRHAAQAGFTIVELLFVCALVAVLATIALPSFFGESKKTKAMAEVQPMFSDMRQRMEQYIQEYGTYPANIGEATLFPAAPTNKLQSLGSQPSTWTAVNFRFTGPTEVYCGYTWSSGNANDGTNIGPEAAAFGFTAPNASWYYLLAHCNLDNDSTVDSFYFTSSVDPTILKRNEGH
ncbi:MAG TPA: type II secretion system protein [Kofleriaceae bacterium]|nr:type II secretion system protein [Kofleriaceae bacterium]